MNEVEKFREDYPLVYKSLEKQKRKKITVADSNKPLSTFIREVVNISTTIEGRKFWQAIAYKEYKFAESLQPYLFITKKERLKSKGYVVERNSFINAE